MPAAVFAVGPLAIACYMSDRDSDTDSSDAPTVELILRNHQDTARQHDHTIQLALQDLLFGARCSFAVAATGLVHSLWFHLSLRRFWH